MARELKFQDPGEGIHEGEVTDVLVSVGDEVQEGNNVLVVETDKATTDLPSPFSGKVEEIRVEAGDVVKVGDVMMTFAGGDEEADDEKQQDKSRQQQAEQESEETAEGDSQQPKEDKEPKKKDKNKAEQQDKKSEGKEEQGKEEQGKEEQGKEEQGKEEQGKEEQEPQPSRRSGGKAAAVGELPEYEEKEKKAKKQPSADKKQAERPVPASPATRRLARELGVDLREIEPSGPHGRVIEDDVRAAAEGKPAEKESPEEKPAEEKSAEEKRPGRAVERPSLPDFEQWGPVEREPLQGIRRQTARRMALSWQEIPHVTHHDLVDITELERWRRKIGPQIEQTGGRLSLMILVMKALASVLARHPRFNASLDTESQELILKRYCHLGVAVDTDDGLVVGVVRDVDRQSVGGLAEAVDQMVERVRNRDVSSEELQGSTFTVTNVGPLGGVAFEPLVNYPEVAILGMARARLQQVVTGDLESPETAVRYMLPLSLSYDHRVNDGADAARFVKDLGDSLHDPDTLLLNV